MMMTQISTEEAAQRIRELMKKKRKLIATMKRGKKIQIKARIEKKKVNDELRSLKGKTNLFKHMTPEEAREEVRRRIEDVKPEHVYPKDLERQFDRLESPSSVEHKVIDLGKVPERPMAKATRSEDTEPEVVAEEAFASVGDDQTEDDGVLDLSDQ